MTNPRTSRSLSIAVFICGLLAPSAAVAETLTLMWDLNTEPEVTGYRVHIGQQPGIYTYTFDVGNTDTYVFENAVTGGQYCFAVTAYSATAVSSLSQEVCTLNDAPPFLSQPFNQSSFLGQSVTLQLSGGDPFGQPVTYSATGLPPGLSVSASTGFISGTPTALGTFTVTARVSDGASSATRTFTWMVGDVNRSPSMTNPGAQSDQVGQSLLLQLQASDPDGQALTFTATGLPPGLSITANTGRITGTPTTAGTYAVDVTASDGSLTAGAAFSWTIRPPNRAPVLSNPGDQTSRANEPLSLQLVATDADEDLLTFAATGLPLGLQLSATTGLITGTPTASGSSTVTITASDGRLFASQIFTWTVHAVNDAPVFTVPANQTHTVGEPLVLQLQASDPEGNALSFVATGLPAGLQLASPTGRIAGIPTTLGTYAVTVTVSDGALTTSGSFTWTIANVYAPPVLVNPGSQTTQIGVSATLQLQGSATNGSPLTYAAAGLPPGLTLAAGTGLISGVPTVAGVFEVTATVNDGTAASTQTFIWTVQSGTAENGAPTLSNPGTRRNNVGDPIALQLNGDDNDGDPITFTAAGLPPGLTIATSTGLITGVVTTAGRYTVIATVSDGTQSVSQGFTWIVRTVNVAPVLTSPGNREDTLGLFTALQLQASDVNGDTLTFSAAGLPAGLQIAADTGIISGTPTTALTFAVTVSVSDGAVSVTASFTWTVNEVNQAPTLTQPGNQFATEGQATSLQLRATDPDGDALLYAASGLPAGLSVSPSSGLVSGVPATAGTFTVVATVTDGSVTVQRSFIWSVQGANEAPVLTNPGAQTTTAGDAVHLQLQATDVNGDALLFAVTGLPAGLQMISSAGLIGGVPSAPGVYTIIATVSDGSRSSQQSFSWTIREANVAPYLATPPSQAATAGDQVMLQLQASDVNGDPLTFSAVGLPPGLLLLSTTGWITGTVLTAGTYAVTVSVTDGLLTTQRAFTWTVQPPPMVAIPAPEESDMDRRTADAAPTGSTALVRQTEPEASSRVYTGATARSRTPDAPAAAPVEYTSTRAVTRSLVQTQAPAPTDGGTSSSGLTSLPTALRRSVAREEDASTTQVLTRDDTDDTALSTTATLSTEPAGQSTAGPTVTIQTPVDTATFAAGSVIHFAATATDAAGTSIASRVVWTSSVDGRLGSGASFTKVLSTGTHVITATVTDNRGRIRTARITVSVG